MKVWVTVLPLALVAVGCGDGSSAPEAARGPVVVYVSEGQMAAIESLPSDVVCFTPGTKPIESLEGLGDDEFASYVTSPAIPQELMAAFGRKDTMVGLRFMGTGGFSFAKEPKLRLFITHESYAEDITDGGGVRIEFRLK